MLIKEFEDADRNEYTYLTDRSYIRREEDELQHLARIKADFKYFFYHICAEALLGGKENFIPNRGFDLLCEYVEDWLDGNQKRLVIAIPPRNLKSQMFSVAAPMWQWLSKSSETFISVSHHDKVLEQFMSARKAVFNHVDYQRAVDFTLTVCTKDTFRNSGSGHILSMVMSHVVTGLGGRYIIIDDPIAAKDGDNPKHCEKMWELYTGTLMSRMDDKKHASMCVISQRVGDADIVGHVAEIGYHVVKLQDISSKKVEIIFPISNQVWIREEGDILNEEYEPLDVLMDIKKANPRSYQAQYQQEPMIEGDGTFSFSKIATYQHLQETYNSIILSCDTAGTIGKKSSNWGLTVWGKYLEGGILCLDLLYCFAGQFEYPEGKKKIKELAESYDVDEIMIEDKSTGIALIPSLKREGYKVISIKPTESKDDRALAASSFIEAGRLRVPDNKVNPWVDRWLTYWQYEIVGFPNARTRDLLDSTTQCVNHFGGKNFSVRQWYGLTD